MEIRKKMLISPEECDLIGRISDYIESDIQETKTILFFKNDIKNLILIIHNLVNEYEKLYASQLIKTTPDPKRKILVDKIVDLVFESTDDLKIQLLRLLTNEDSNFLNNYKEIDKPLLENVPK